MLGTSQISVTYSYSGTIDNHENKESQSYFPLAKNAQNHRLGAILTENVVDGKLTVQKYALPDDFSEDDIQRRLALEDQASSWTYVNYRAYNSGIILFDGKASKSGENLWEISPYKMMNPVKDQFNDKTSENPTNFGSSSHGVYSDTLTYKVVFSGKKTENSEENFFAVFFANSIQKNLDVDQNIRFQVIEMVVNSEKSTYFQC